MVVMTSGNPTCQWIMTSNGRGTKAFISSRTVNSVEQFFSTLKIMSRIFPKVMAYISLNCTLYLMLFCLESTE